MQIGELAKRTALSVDAIRFYEKQRLLPKATRSVGGFRLFTVDDIQHVQFIRQMHKLGFSLREIKELMGLRARKAGACESVRELLNRKLEGIRARMRDLRKLECELLSDLRKCDRELRHRRQHAASGCPILEQVATR